ncbi:MAG: M16 family metallopeptidase [Candidatus Acetothermia bacterium]
MELYPGCFRRTLSNKITVIGEEVPTSKSVSLGVWFDSGSRDETDGLYGITHLIEHLLFRGTENRTAYEISSDVDRIGGLINGSTATEFLLLSLQLLPNSIDRGIAILSDLVSNPSFDKEDMTLEKDVVLEEIHSSHDDHQRESIRLFEQTVWGEESGLARPVLGTEETVRSITVQEVADRFSQLRRPEKITVTAGGKLNFELLVDQVGAKFADILDASGPSTPDGGEGPGEVAAQEKINGQLRDIHQLHVVIGVEGIPRSDERRYPLEMLNVLLGHGMSSRLFRKVRKERGLAYHVVSNTQYYSDSGLFYVYGAIDPDNLDEYRDLVIQEFEDLSTDCVTDEELELAKQKTKGNLVLGLENNEALMGRLGVSSIYGTELLSVSKVLEKIDAVSKEEIKAVATSLLEESEINMSLLGPEVGIDLP